MTRFRKFLILAVVMCAALLMGALSTGERFVVRIAQWPGQSSDELYSEQLGQVADMCNFEVMVEGGQTFLQQRHAIKRITSFLGGGGLTVYSFALYSPRGLNQYIVLLAGGGGVGKFYSTQGLSLSLGDWDSISAMSALPYAKMAQFKDTLIVPLSSSQIKLVAVNAGNLAVAATYNSVAYSRVLIHQDRVYLHNVAYTSSVNDDKLAWMPEFDMRFNTLDTALGSGYVYVGRGDGDFITNVLPLGSNLVAYKSHTIYNVLIGTETNKPEQIVKITDNIGAVAYDAACAYNSIHYFVSADGVYRFDGSGVQKISAGLDSWFRDSLQIVKTVENGVIRIEAVDDRLYVCLPVRGATPTTHGGMRIFVYDLVSQQWWKMIPNPVPTNGNYRLLRYDYPDGVNQPIADVWGGFHYKSKLLLCYDSSSTPAIYMFPGDRADGTPEYSDMGGRITATYTTALSGIGDLWSRKQLERASVFGSGAMTCTVKVDWYDQTNAILDSTKFPMGTTGSVVLKRLPPTISGQMLKFRLRTNDTAAVKINALEIVGSQKGLANDQ